MTTFALVHGGWHGAWCWELLSAELTARGHRTVTADLPAGDPTAGAEAYAAVVLAALAGTPARRAAERGRSRPGDGVVLVGHSLAGLTVPLVAAATDVRHAVYVAGMLPEPGRSVDERARAGERQTRRGLGRGLTVEPDGSTSWLPDAAVEWLYPDSPPERAREAAAKLRPQHWRVTAEPSPLPSWPGGPATYVLCRDDRVIDTDWARVAAVRRGLELVEIDGDHSPFLARPAELADLLTGLAAA